MHNALGLAFEGADPRDLFADGIEADCFLCLTASQAPRRHQNRGSFLLTNSSISNRPSSRPKPDRLRA